MKLFQEQDGPDEKGASHVDYRRIKLLQASSEESDDERKANNEIQSKNSSVSHVNDSDEEPNTPH